MSVKRPVAAFLADVHWTTNTPEYRKETCPFNEVIAKKLAVVSDYVRGHNIIGHVAGDLFDRSRNFLDYWTMREFENDGFVWKEGSDDPAMFRIVSGQHDRFHHNAEDKATSLNLLLEGEDRAYLREPFPEGEELCRDPKIVVYGAGWNDPLPEPIDKDDFNVLFWHKTLWWKKPVYPGQTEGNVSSESVRLSKLGYKMVFSGDNHRAFDAEIGGVRFHNLGAFTRNSVALADQRPRFCVLFDDLSVESVYVGEEDVFDMGRSDADKGRESTKDAFSEALAGGFDRSQSFKGNLEEIAKSGKCGDAVLTEKQKGLVQDVVNSI